MIPLYTVTEVSKLLKVNRNFVYDLIRKGELEAVRIGSIKVRKDAVERYIDNNTVTTSGGSVKTD